MTGEPDVSAQVTRGGEATEEEVAAIVAAVQAVTARSDAPPLRPQPPRWRFSGRWWSKPVPLRRNRHW